MEERCSQFASDAGTVQPPKREGETKKLRKFLMRNQEQTFTDRARTHLFTAIERHVSSGEPFVEDLVQDALQMPARIFADSSKKQMIKWLDRFAAQRGEGNDLAAAGAGAALPVTSAEVLDVTTECVTLMIDDDGTTIDVLSSAIEAELFSQIQTKFESDEPTTVEYSATSAAQPKGKQVFQITKICGD